MKKDAAKENNLTKQNLKNLKRCGMTPPQEFPEHILEAIDLVSAVLRRIKEKRQNLSRAAHLDTIA